MRIIKNGIPGSAMPKFDKLTEEECRAIMGHVRQLARAGVYQRWLARAVKEDKDDPDLQGAAKKVEPEVAVLGPAGLPQLPPVRSLATGKKIFDTSCAECHGPLGKGDGKQEQFDDNKVPIRPEDLTTGTYKGGGRTEYLLARIYLGVPGTPMPATDKLPCARPRRPDRVRAVAGGEVSERTYGNSGAKRFSRVWPPSPGPAASEFLVVRSR